MLLKKTPAPIKRKITLELPAELWSRFDELKKKATKNGYQIDLEGSLSGYLQSQITRAERALQQELQSRNQATSLPFSDD